MTKNCVIIGAAPINNKEIEFIKHDINKDNYIICADGGYKIAKNINVKPDLVIGDFDSLEIEIEKEIEIIKLPTKKDETDTFYCAKEALKRGFKKITIYAGTSGRLDHTIANLGTLLFIEESGASGILTDSCAEILVKIEKEVNFKDKNNKKISIYPFSINECIVTYKGLEYALENAKITSSYPYGVSNSIVSNTASIIIHKGPVLIIITK